MQYFYIKEGSINPPLRMELVNDGRYEFMQEALFNDSIQNASVTFTMRDETDMLVISKAPCNIIHSDSEGCNDRYIIEYQWKGRDTKKSGQYTGTFEINFNGDTYQEGVTYPSGNLIMPIHEKLGIMILP